MSASTSIRASFASSVQGAPDKIVYLPKGSHTITPHGVEGEVTINVDESITAAFQQSLERRQGQKVRPYLDFDHKRGAASAIPKSFEWDDELGLVLALEWTGKGRKAIEGKDFSYFSPEFLADLENNMPVSLPSRGPLGGLVNEPAFEEIPRIAAKNADDTKPKHIPMDNTSLVSAGILTSEESSKDDSVSVAAKRFSDVKLRASQADSAEKRAVEAEKKAEAVEAELVELKAKAKEVADARIETVLKAAFDDGRLDKSDEDTVGFWRDSLASNESAFKALDKLSAKKQHLKGSVTSANISDDEFEKNPILAAMEDAKAKGESSAAAVALAARNNPGAYAEYRSSNKS